jgi:hypothetical protein
MKKNQNNFKALITFVILPLILFSSCISTFVEEERLYVRKGQSFEKVLSHGINPKQTFELIGVSKKYKSNIKVFKINMPTANVRDNYFYAFRNDSLIFWGFPYKFLRHENEQLRDIASEMIDSLKAN